MQQLVAQGKSKKGLVWADHSTAKSKGNPHAYIRKSAKNSHEKIYLSRDHVKKDLSENKHRFFEDLNAINEKEIMMLNSQYVDKLKKSVIVDRMPSVKVRPTINIEVK